MNVNIRLVSSFLVCFMLFNTTAFADGFKYPDGDADKLITASDAAMAAIGSGNNDLDVNGDGVVDYNDAELILSKALNDDITFNTIETPTEGASEESSEAASEASTDAIPEGYNKIWNFGDSGFLALAGNITAVTEVDGVTLIASEEENCYLTVEKLSSSVSVSGTSYGGKLRLNGAGSVQKRALSFDLAGKTDISVVLQSTSASDVRELDLCDEDGNVLASYIVPGTAAFSTKTVDYTGRVYLWSKAKGVDIYAVTRKASQGSEDYTGIGAEEPSSGQYVTVSDFDGLVSGVKAMAAQEGGGTVYVDAKTIDCTDRLTLNSSSGNPVKIEGVMQSDGTYPVLDFKSLRDSKVGSLGQSLTSSSDDGVGIRISGKNYTVKNLIIQKAADNGIQIKGSGAANNTIESCIVRYNNDAGVQLAGGASYNLIKYVSSYRNCDVYTRGGNADGFAPKLGTTGNVFYGCYAWDNSDDGWDSFDKDESVTDSITYEQCACWNNGNPDVFTGKYDFDNGNELDADLFLVELICEQDPDFASNYANGSFSLPTDAFINTDLAENSVITLSAWTGDSYSGNPNGFKFGSSFSPAGVKRVAKNCLAFNNGANGFDKNNSSCSAYLLNCIAFDNGCNFDLSKFTFTFFSDAYSFDGGRSDSLPSGYATAVPSADRQAEIRDTVASTSQEIISKCYSNIISDTLFDIYD